jgi:hypothetical protein
MLSRAALRFNRAGTDCVRAEKRGRETHATRYDVRRHGLAVARSEALAAQPHLSALTLCAAWVLVAAQGSQVSPGMWRPAAPLPFLFGNGASRMDAAGAVKPLLRTSPRLVKAEGCSKKGSGTDAHE